MRRTASEVLRSLEMRVARLERQSAQPNLLDLVEKGIPFKTVRDRNQLKFVVKQIGVEFTVDTSPEGVPRDVVYIQAVANQYAKDGQYNSALEAVMRSGLFGTGTGWSGHNGKLIASKYFQIRDLNKGAREIVHALKGATKKLSA